MPRDFLSFLSFFFATFISFEYEKRLTVDGRSSVRRFRRDSHGTDSEFLLGHNFTRQSFEL